MNLITNLFEFRNHNGNNIENPFDQREEKKKYDLKKRNKTERKKNKNTFTIE